MKNAILGLFVFVQLLGMLLPLSAQTANPDSVVVVFCDGSEKWFSLSEVARVDFRQKAGSQPVTIAPTPTRDSIGRSWDITGEGGWKAVWTRAENSNSFNGVWTGPKGERVTTTVTISINGRNVSAKRVSSSDGILADYSGQLSSDGNSVNNGVGKDARGGKWKWSAKIHF